MKQVIVVRKDLNMRKGKMIAQGSHASVGVVYHEFDSFIHALQNGNDLKDKHERFERYGTFRSWINGNQKKICVSVDSEKELLDLFAAAKEAKLPCYLVKDAGFTEFKEPTYTALAIGPADEKLIDPLTGNLKLL